MTLILENSTVMPFRWYGNKYLCFFCCCSFVDSRELKEHTKREHKNAKLRNVMRFLVGKGRIKFDISEISCKNCPKPVRDLKEFLTHLSEHHDMSFVNFELLNRLFCYKLSDESLNCLECGEEFMFFSTLLKHHNKHHPRTGSYLCEICGQGFAMINHVNSHKKIVHSTDNGLKQCEDCEKTFPSTYELTKHYEHVHKPEKLKCPKCPEVLGSRYLKKRHMALCHDVKSAQFKCSSCPRVFCWKNKLVQHTRRVHLKEKSASCDICGFRGFSQEELKRHMVKHDDSRPFQCEYCKKTFQRKKTLDFHTRIHTNDRRYTCDACGKAFIQVSSLKLHLRVHHQGPTASN